MEAVHGLSARSRKLSNGTTDILPSRELGAEFGFGRSQFKCGNGVVGEFGKASQVCVTSDLHAGRQTSFQVHVDQFDEQEPAGLRLA